MRRLRCQRWSGAGGKYVRPLAARSGGEWRRWRTCGSPRDVSAACCGMWTQSASSAGPLHAAAGDRAPLRSLDPLGLRSPVG